MAVCPPAPPLFLIPWPWDAPFAWGLLAGVVVLNTVGWRNIYCRRLRSVTPRARKQRAITLFAGYIAFALGFAAYPALVALPALFRLFSFLDASTARGCFGATDVVSHRLGILAVTILIVVPVGIGVNKGISTYNRRLGLPEWRVEFPWRRQTDTNLLEGNR